MNIDETNIKVFGSDAPGTPCSECKAFSFPLNLENLTNYFWGKPIICPKCSAKLDWWTLLLRHFDWNFPHYLYGIVGATDTRLMIRMKPNEVLKLDMIALGIPADAKILHINYTPNGKGLFPLEVHGNTPIRHFTPHQIILFGRPFGEPAPETPVAVSISWIQTTSADESWQNLVQAVEAYSIGKFQSAIIPANVAVEAKLSNVLQNHLSRFSSVDRVSDFLETRATYSYQLNILLPMLASYSGFPQLPDHIRGNLNLLRDHRNDLAHKGAPAKPLNKPNCARMLCSAIFGLGYVSLFECNLNN